MIVFPVSVNHFHHLAAVTLVCKKKKKKKRLSQSITDMPPSDLTGGVKDSTGSFNSVVMICMMCCLAGGLVLLAYPLAVRLEHRRPERYRLLPMGAEQTL